MLSLLWLRGLLRRRPFRLTGASLGVAIAIALLASIGAFLSSAKASMTSHAASSVAVDWQVGAQPGADPRAVLGTVASSPGTRAAVPVDYASVGGFLAGTGGTTQAAGAGVVVGLPPEYQSTFPGSVRPLVGGPVGVLLTQQTAANLHAKPGDSVSVTGPALPPATFHVDGVAELPRADSLFQKVGARPGAQPSAPPDNVLILPAAQWHVVFDGLSAAHPDLVQHQVHVALGRSLPSDPASAFTAVTGAARNLEAKLGGTGTVANNVGAALDAARSDALYAQVLFLVLGVPGAILAGGLTAAVAASGSERRRHEQALLRTRGATRAHLVRLALAEAALVGVVGAALGLGVAAVVGAAAFGSLSFGATAASSIGWAGGAVVAGLLIAALTVAVPAHRDATQLTVADTRRLVRRYTQPVWARYGLDLLLLVAAGVIVWLTTRAGYNLVLAPEGVPSISVSYWALLGPVFAWIGAGLFVWRLASGTLGRGASALRHLLRPVSGALATTVTASLGRQRRRLAIAVVIVALTGAFAGSTAVFNSTYTQQVGVDARLTNGADVTVTEPPGSTIGPGGAAPISATPGVRHVEPLQHRFAYVGSDLQDLYGIRASTVTKATPLENAYFSGGTAPQILQRLRTHPDGVLVSAETARDFQLQSGDLLRLRLSDGSTGELRTINFHYVGVAKEFPTAPKDSFLVANAGYVAAQTHTPAVGAFLVDTGSASPSAVASRLRTVVGPSVTVTDIQTSRKVAGSSLTALDLSGLTKVELGFAVALATGASGLLMALVLAERRRTFTIAAALGARSGQVASFARSEAAFVTVAGLLAAVGVAWMLAKVLVRVLTGVFDPAPAHLAVPWGYLVTVSALALVAASAAAEITARASRRSVTEGLRDL